MIDCSDIKNKTAVITGGSGVIGSALVKALADAGVKTAILARNEQKVKALAGQVQKETGTPVLGFSADVLDRKRLEEVKKIIHGEFGKIDFLINGAGGNSPKATTKLEQLTSKDLNNMDDSFFGLDTSGFDDVFDLNFKGTLIPTMIFTKEMTEKGEGVIVNISSMNAFNPLTKIPAYSAAKAAINNFTQWLAVHFAKTGVRVNAIAPGFFLTDQNRFLLLDENGNPTERGKKIINNTPMGRYGEVEELQGTLLYLLSDISKFVTGVVIPVDGGYSAFGGV
jgi:NAD(P)-dependent dehydrogenase (short-subunit alcohol dehydrogenase family)